MNLINTIGTTINDIEEEKNTEWLIETNRTIDLVFPPETQNNICNSESSNFLIKNTESQERLQKIWSEEQAELVKQLDSNTAEFCASTKLLKINQSTQENYNLNRNQQIAFDMFTELVHDVNQPQKLIYLTGEGNKKMTMS